MNTVRDILFKDGQFYYKLSDILEILNSLGTKITKKQFIKQIAEGCYKKVSSYTGFYGLFQAIKDMKAIFFNLNLQSYEKAEKIIDIYNEVVNYNKEALNGLQGY